MAEPIAEGQAQGVQHVERLSSPPDALDDAGSDRGAAGHRALFFDGDCKLVLRYLFDPVIDSLRALRDAAALPEAAAAMAGGRFSLGSFPESVLAFDLGRLMAVVAEPAEAIRPPGVAATAKEIVLDLDRWLGEREAVDAAPNWPTSSGRRWRRRSGPWRSGRFGPAPSGRAPGSGWCGATPFSGR